MKLTLEVDDALNAEFEEALPPHVKKSPVVRDLLRIYVDWRRDNPESYKITDIYDKLMPMEPAGDTS